VRTTGNPEEKIKKTIYERVKKGGSEERSNKNAAKGIK
jgi:hypothetical protein